MPAVGSLISTEAKARALPFHLQGRGGWGWRDALRLLLPDLRMGEAAWGSQVWPTGAEKGGARREKNELDVQCKAGQG